MAISNRLHAAIGKARCSRRSTSLLATCAPRTPVRCPAVDGFRSACHASLSARRTLASASSSLAAWKPTTVHNAIGTSNRTLRHAALLPSALRPYSDNAKPPTPRPNDPQAANGKLPTDKPLPQPISAAREKTKAVSAKVRSSLPKLQPRENIYNLPNFLTVTRLIAAPTTAYLLLHDQHTAAFALFAYAGITDLVDGWIARKWKLQTVAGSVIDPAADKALMIILTVTLAVKGAIPAYLATLILGRDASLLLAASYYRYASLPAPKTFMRYWNFSLPSAEVHPTTVSKYNTFLQILLIGSALALPVVTADSHHLGVLHDIGMSGLDLHQAMVYFQWIVAGTTAWSGLSYAYLKNAVTILGDNEALKAKQGARGRAIIGVTFGSVVLAAAYLAVTVDAQREKAENDLNAKKSS